MYDKQYAAMQASNVIGGSMVATEVDRDPTIEENLDQRISYLKAELAKLEDAKKNLGPLLPMKISAIRSAMNY